MKKNRVFIIGLDGGSWDIILPLVEKGLLPNIKALINKSSWGILHSTFPASTCPAWFTFSTGLKPPRLGIYHIQNMPPGENRLTYAHYGEIKNLEFWDILMQEGMSCGIINHPMLFHRKHHQGYIVPGSVVPEAEYHTFPSDLMDELHTVTGGYELDQQGLYIIDDETLLNGCLSIAEKRTEAMCYLMTRYPTDFFLGVYTIPDRVCHRFLTRASLGEGEESEHCRKALQDSYIEVDRGIGRLQSLIAEDDFLMIISDHGFKAKPWNFYVNQFLMEEGLLKIDTRNKLQKMGLTQRNLGMYLGRLGFRMQWIEKIRRLVPAFLRDLLPAGETVYGEYMLADLIDQGQLDWSKTRAIFLGSGIYLNTTNRHEGIVRPSEVEKIKKRIMEGLEELRDPDGGPPAVKAVEPEEVYGEGMYINPPDLMIVGEDEWEKQNTLSAAGELFTPNSRAGHSREGIFALKHPWVEPGKLAQPLEMEDLAPLILHLYGQPIPEEMDGRVRLDIFRKDAEISREVIRQRWDQETTLLEKMHIKERVAKLKKDGSL